MQFCYYLLFCLFCSMTVFQKKWFSSPWQHTHRVWAILVHHMLWWRILRIALQQYTNFLLLFLNWYSVFSGRRRSTTSSWRNWMTSAMNLLARGLIPSTHCGRTSISMLCESLSTSSTSCLKRLKLKAQKHTRELVAGLKSMLFTEQSC